MLDNYERRALENLNGHAKRSSGQASRVADFLLCWWNAQDQGKFDFTQVWAFDKVILGDVITVFSSFAARKGLYADKLGDEEDFKKIIRLHR